MEYVCLRNGCANTANAAGNCPTHGHGPLRAVKVWADQAKSDYLDTVAYFNPSTRRVAFDVHLDHGNHAVYVVLWISLSFETGERGAPGWSSADKAAFRKHLKAGASVLDAQVTFTSRGQAYTPYFFIEEPWVYGSTVEITAKTLSDAEADIQPDALPGNAGVQFGTADYPVAPPAAGAGTTHAGVKCFLSILSPRAFVVGGMECIPFVHELGHMLGLPDEYDAFPPGGGVVPPQAGGDWSKKDRAILYWVQSLNAHNIALPQWGQFGNGHGQVNEHSLMRDVATGAGALMPRHYVPILEGVEYASARSTHVRDSPWTVA